MKNKVFALTFASSSLIFSLIGVLTKNYEMKGHFILATIFSVLIGSIFLYRWITQKPKPKMKVIKITPKVPVVEKYVIYLHKETGNTSFNKTLPRNFLPDVIKRITNSTSESSLSFYLNSRLKGAAYSVSIIEKRSTREYTIIKSFNK